MAQLSVLLGGRACRRCIRALTRRLRDVPGVRTVTIGREGDRVLLTGTMTEADVLEAVRSPARPAGADVRPTIT